jgi:hypothetical protein
MEGKSKRNSGIELLRIICLFLIFWMHGASSFSENAIGAWGSVIADSIGNIGVPCFILISGYFGIRLNGKKLIKLDLMLIFYCWIGLALEYFWGTQMAGETILSYLMPVIGKRSWYFTCYFALAFLSPFLNAGIERLEQRQFQKLLMVMLLIFSGVTTIFFFDITGDGGKGIVQMVMLYLIGRYIRIYEVDKKYPQQKLWLAFVCVTLANIVLNGALYVATGVVQNRFARDNSLFIIAEAVLLFLIFCRLKLESKAINTVAGCVPAVFIMEWTLRELTAYHIYNYLQWSNSSIYPLVVLLMAAVLILVGTLIESARKILLRIPEEKLSELLYGFWCAVDKKLLSLLRRGEKSE